MGWASERAQHGRARVAWVRDAPARVSPRRLGKGGGRRMGRHVWVGWIAPDGMVHHWCAHATSTNTVTQLFGDTRHFWPKIKWFGGTRHFWPKIKWFGGTRHFWPKRQYFCDICHQTDKGCGVAWAGVMGCRWRRVGSEWLDESVAGERSKGLAGKVSRAGFHGSRRSRRMGSAREMHVRGRGWLGLVCAYTR